MSDMLWLNEVRGGEDFIANMPRWTRDPLDRFAETIGAKPPWSQIVGWYRALLPSAPGAIQSFFGREKELQIATQPNEFWRGDATDVLRKIEKGEFIVGLGSERGGEGASTPVVDIAAHEDQLGRELFAVQLANMLHETRLDQLKDIDALNAKRALEGKSADVTGDGFAVHLHAPWGAGKTSILHMMRDEFTRQDRGDGERWAVAHFKAWRHERRRPPWWPMMEALYASAQDALDAQASSGFAPSERAGFPERCARTIRRLLPWFFPKSRRPVSRKAAKLWRRWHWSNLKSFTGPFFKPVAVAIFILFAIIALVAPIGDYAKVVTTAVSMLGGLAVAANWFVHGSVDGKNSMSKWTDDPLERVVSIFKAIVDEVGVPVCIFIDDLDRCDADFVVDLLEGVQSAFRHQDVIYVVAADKDWIRSAFETRYASFDSQVSRPGQPLGYLFLEKIFQMSIPVPGISEDMKKNFVNRKFYGDAKDDVALEHSAPSSQEDPGRIIQELQSESQRKGGITGDEARAFVARSDAPEVKKAVIEAYGGSTQAQIRQESLLGRYVKYLPDNPRLIVRLGNTFSMRNIVGFLEGAKSLSDEVVARWIVLEQRYPALADLLVQNPWWINILGDEDAQKDKNETLDPILAPYIGLEPLIEIIGVGEGDELNLRRVKEITRGSRV